MKCREEEGSVGRNSEVSGGTVKCQEEHSGVSGGRMKCKEEQ